jgi:cytochrome c biogenesis factor
MCASAILIAVNAVLSNPFRLVEGPIPTDGLGLNPLLRTFWNTIHPPLVFIAYALILVPFAIKLAGFTVRTEERNTDLIPTVESISRFSTVLAWIFLSLGIVIGGYWAYIVLGWGGYWAWDPVETTSLIPWLLLTCYYHAKPIFRKNDVLRDSFLVFAYVSVIFATWVTRSGVLSSVHGFSISIVSWSMLTTLIGTFLFATIITIWSGYRDLEDDEEEGESSQRKEPISPLHRITGSDTTRELSIKISLLGLLVITGISVIGVLLPAVLNLQAILIDPSGSAELITVGIEFFWMGFYAGSFFLAISAYYCMDSTILSLNRKTIFAFLLVIIGGVLGVVSFLDPLLLLPTPSWMANLLVPVTVGAVVYLLVYFTRLMLGKEKGPFTMRKMGRTMLHLGMILLVCGVLFSENSIYETNHTYQLGTTAEIAPNVFIRVDDIDLVYWNHERDFRMEVTLLVIEGTTIVGIGITAIQGHPEFGSVSHIVYLHTTIFRDVFIAMTGFTQVGPVAYAVTLHAKILPFISLVWTGSFFLIAAILPMAGMEYQQLRKSLREKEDDFEDDGSKEEAMVPTQ